MPTSRCGCRGASRSRCAAVSWCLRAIAPLLELPEEPIDGLTVLFDTSASRALGFGAQIERLAALLAALRQRAGKDFEAARGGVRPDRGGDLPRPGQRLRPARAGPAARARGARRVGPAAGARPARARAAATHARVLVVSDGVVTAGAGDTHGAARGGGQARGARRASASTCSPRAGSRTARACPR